MAAPSPPPTPGNAGLAVSPSAQALLGHLATLWVMGSALLSVAMGQRHAGSAVGSDPWSGCWSHSWLRLEPRLSAPRPQGLRPACEGGGGQGCSLGRRGPRAGRALQAIPDGPRASNTHVYPGWASGRRAPHSAQRPALRPLPWQATPALRANPRRAIPAPARPQHTRPRLLWGLGMVKSGRYETLPLSGAWRRGGLLGQ